MICSPGRVSRGDKGKTRIPAIVAGNLLPAPPLRRNCGFSYTSHFSAHGVTVNDKGSNTIIIITVTRYEILHGISFILACIALLPRSAYAYVLNAPYRLGIDTQSMRTYASSTERSYISLPRSKPLPTCVSAKLLTVYVPRSTVFMMSVSTTCTISV